MDPEGGTLVDMMAQVQDIVEPAPVSMWPATWAWAVLALVLLAALALVLRAWLRHRHATAYRRAALAELKAIRPQLERADLGALARLDVLIRRTALAGFPRRDVASLTGADWIAFLDQTGGKFEPYADALTLGPYRGSATVSEGRALGRAARHWIARHHA